MSTDFEQAATLSLPHSALWSLVLGEQWYRIMVAWPTTAPPAAGFPVHFLLDADLFFGALVDGVRARERRRDATGVEPAVVVGIALDGDRQALRSRRHFDFTPPTLEALLPPTDLGTPWPPHGGAEVFGAWLTGPVRALVERHYPVDPGRTTLFAHSLAGLCAVDLLTRTPDAFGRWQIASPSLWWYRDRLHEIVGRLGASPPATEVTLAVGEYEDQLAPWQLGHPDAAQIAIRRAARRMGPATAELADALRRHLPPSAVQLVRYLGEDHASVPFRLFLDGLRPPQSASSPTSSP